MSHFTVGVIIDKNNIDRNLNIAIDELKREKGMDIPQGAIKAALYSELEYYVEKALVPFDENLEVDAHRALTIEELNKERDEVISYNGEDEWKIELKEKYTNLSLEEFAEGYFGYELREDGAYARYNLNGKWDWYVIGGRWNNTLPIKNYTPNKDEDYDGYENKCEGNVCRIKDIELHEELNELEERKLRKKYQSLIEGKGMYKAEYIQRKYPTFETYLKDYTTFNTYALLTSKGEWVEPGKIGWFGCSSASPEEERDFSDIFIQKLQEEDPENYFIVVDCHV